MFDYLINKQKFLMKLGNYISHEIIKKHVENDINDFDRLYLAYSFKETLHEYYLEGSIPQEDLVWDIARYIDKRVPQSYVKWRDKLHDDKPNNINASKYKTGLIYHFKENRELSSVEDLEDEKLIQLYENLDLYYNEIYGAKYDSTPYSIRKNGITGIVEYFKSKNSGL